MIKIRFNNETIKHDVEFRRINENIVFIIGGQYENTNGFITYDSNDERIGDFSDYKTVYRFMENGVQYSNDGSVWVEPTTEIKAVFDKNAPEKVEVKTSSGETIDLLNPTFTSIVSGDSVIIVEAEELVDFNMNINGATVNYIEKTEEEKREEEHERDISEQTYLMANMFVEMGINVDDFLDRLDAQSLYTALMTDSLLPEGE